MKLTTALLLSSSAGLTTAIGFGKRPPEPPKTHVIDSFHWRDPFTPKASAGFTPVCEATATFPATEFTLHDLFEKQPGGLLPWGDGLKKFFSGREYPGGWAGLDRHMNDRSLLKMEYADLPRDMRGWIETQDRMEDAEGKGLFAVFFKPQDADEKITDRVEAVMGVEIDRALDKDKVVIFAPGALYTVLPLFVASTVDRDCSNMLIDVTRYSPDPKDGGVVAWPVKHTRPSKDEDTIRQMEFTIKAQVLKADPEAKKSAEAAEAVAEAVAAEEKAQPSAKEGEKDEL